MTSMQALTAETLREWRLRVSEAELTGDDAAMIDELRELETLKCAIEARQARLAVAFDEAQRRRAAEAGEPAERQGRGIAAQIALARRVSPRRGRQLLGLAKILTNELPHTMAAFGAGRVSEWRATILARETACLDLADRLAVDEAVAGDPVQLERRGDRELGDLARTMAERLDNAAVAKRRARAEAERCVTLRPAPDTMVYLTALLPVAQGVAAYAALKTAADTAVASGAETSRGRAMADALVARITGATAQAEDGRPVTPVRINLTMSAGSLLAGTDDDAAVSGYGPIPATLARAIAADALDAGVRVWVRRLFTAPVGGALVGLEKRSRLFPKGLRDFLELRDRFCRNPWCGARIRHYDHIEPHAEGGPTSADNGQGLCEACNHAKQTPGWRASPVNGPPDEPHRVATTTPTGHRYTSTAPAA